MPCNCNKTALLPCCITNLTIGTTDSYAGALLVAFRLPIGRVDYYAVTVGFTGAIVLTDLDIQIGPIYEVYLVTDADRTTEIPFSIGEVEVSCLNLQFEYSDSIVENQTVTLT